jgi:ABC-type tungstate transport system substrate-binding protein
MRRRVAPPAGLALLLAGGALLVRVTVMSLAGDTGRYAWLFTAAACVLGGVALVLVALPKIAVPAEGTADQPTPELPRG